MVGELIAGRYELEELVGKGGMSGVYRAHDRLLERKVAIKILHEHYTADADYVERFRREARAAAKLSHPNIVTVIDRGAAIGETILARMQAWQERWDAIGDARGLGAMLAIELVHDRETKNPAPDLATKVVEAAAERGLLLLKSGIYSNVIRVLVPLTIADAELEEALGVWEQALEHVLGA